MREILPEYKELLVKLEGLKLQAYKDSGGVWTIGVGHTPSYEGQKITKDQAYELLSQDLKKFEDCIYNSVRVKLTNNQFAALVIFTFNIGQEAFKNSTLLKLLNQGKYDEVPAQLARWNKVNKQVVQGLVNRRSKEIELWNQSTTQIPQKRKWYNPMSWF